MADGIVIFRSDHKLTAGAVSLARNGRVRLAGRLSVVYQRDRSLMYIGVRSVVSCT
jgi:hypothetical protein